MSQGLECALKALLAIGVALLLVGLAKGRPAALVRHRTGLLRGITVLGALAVINFGGLHTDGTALHLWDQYHYFVGSKYFAELGYDGLYVATIEARKEQLPKVAPPQRLRDLRSNQLVPLASVAGHVAEVRARFSPERWQQFSEDASRFYLRDDIYLDNGLKATPTHIQVLRAFSRFLPFRTRSMYLVALLDVALLALGAFAVRRAFGLAELAGFCVCFGLGFCSRYYWVGGAFLRHDWLIALVLAAALLESGRVRWAALALAYASIVRLFPTLFLVPLLVHWIAQRRWQTLTRFCTVFGLAAAALFLLGFVGQPLAWPQSIHGLLRHSRTVFPNSIGLRVPLITSLANARGDLVNPSTLYDYVAISRDYAATLHSRWWLVVLATAGFVGLALRAAWRAPTAAAAFALGIVLVFALTAPTGYYGTYFALLPLVRPVRTSAVFLVATSLTYVVAAMVLFSSNAGWMRLNGAAVFGPAALLLAIVLLDWMRHFPARERSAAS